MNFHVSQEDAQKAKELFLNPQKPLSGAEAPSRETPAQRSDDASGAMVHTSTDHPAKSGGTGFGTLGDPSEEEFRHPSPAKPAHRTPAASDAPDEGFDAHAADFTPSETGAAEYDKAYKEPIVSHRRGITGKVSNLHRLEPSQVHRGLNRWMRSLFGGYPYATRRCAWVFSLVTDDFDAGKHKTVIVPGEIMNNTLGKGERVTVRGSLDGNGRLVAKSITNVDSDSEEEINYRLSAWAVRLITLLLIVLFYFAAMVLLTLGRGVFQLVRLHLAEIVFYGILIVICVNWLRRRFGWFRRRRRWRY